MSANDLDDQGVEEQAHTDGAVPTFKPRPPDGKRHTAVKANTSPAAVTTDPLPPSHG